MIAMFGGSFDPVHIGHLRMAIEVRDALNIEQMHLIPCGQPPHRDAFVATPEQRWQMLQLALSEEHGLLADDRELRLGRPSYTVSTLTDLRKEYGNSVPIGLMIGADAYQHLETWYQWQSLLELAHLIVAYRPGYAISASDLVNEFAEERIIRQPHQLKTQPYGHIYFVEIPSLQVSSTRIRSMIAVGNSIRYLVPDPVFDYISMHQLYARHSH